MIVKTTLTALAVSYPWRKIAWCAVAAAVGRTYSIHSSNADEIRPMKYPSKASHLYQVLRKAPEKKERLVYSKRLYNLDGLDTCLDTVFPTLGNVPKTYVYTKK